MGTVDKITYIKGTDKTFVIRAVFKESKEAKDLSSFVGSTGDGLSLNLPGENGTVTLTLDSSSEGVLQVVDAQAGMAGKVQVTISDSSTIKPGLKQNMELAIKEGAGPDFEVSCIQFKGCLEVKEKLF